MLKVMTAAAVAAVTLGAALAPQPAAARDGAIAAGVVGGLAAGAIIGSAAANRGYYNGPSYYESGYQPVYRSCRVEREEFVDSYGRVRVRRIRVCD